LVATQPDVRQRAVVHSALVTHFELTPVDDELAVYVASVKDACRDRHLGASAADTIAFLEHDSVGHLEVAVGQLCAEAHGLPPLRLMRRSIASGDSRIPAATSSS